MTADIIDLNPYLETKDADYPSRAHRVRAARDRVVAAMHALDLTEDSDLWSEIQQTYFALEARVLALDPVHQNVDMPGTDVSLGRGYVRVMDGVTVADPENPTTKHGVTVDHAITENDVQVEVNGVPVDHVGQEPGSYIR